MTGWASIFWRASSPKQWRIFCPSCLSFRLSWTTTPPIATQPLQQGTGNSISDVQPAAGRQDAAENPHSRGGTEPHHAADSIGTAKTPKSIRPPAFGQARSTTLPKNVWDQLVLYFRADAKEHLSRLSRKNPADATDTQYMFSGYAGLGTKIYIVDTGLGIPGEALQLPAEFYDRAPIQRVAPAESDILAVRESGRRRSR